MCRQVHSEEKCILAKVGFSRDQNIYLPDYDYETFKVKVKF